jgi:CHAT domain-containing protein/predicted negative regulator of RcsB-dependent stress response
MAIKNKYESDHASSGFRRALRFFCSAMLLFAALATGIAETPPVVTVDNAKPIDLIAGAVINRELAAGAKELLEISLSSGDLLRFLIEKGDLSLSLTLYDPVGQKLLEHVSYGYEVLEFSVPAEAAGKYVLEIRSLELDKSVRHYELKADPIRRATPADYKSNLAQRASASASVLRANWTEKSLRQAIEKYDEAALLWLSSNNLRNAAVATMEAGEVCFALGEYREALRRYQKAAAQAKKAAAKLEESKALSETGRLYSYLGDNDEAQRRVLEAVKLLAIDSQPDQPATLKDNYAESLNNLGEISYSKGDLAKSSKHFEDALKIFADIGDRKGEARALLFQGYIVGGLDDRETAVARITHALELYRAIGNKTGEALCLTVLALAHAQDDEGKAIKLHRDASVIFRSIGDGQSEAIALNGVGQAYENLKDYSAALDNYQDALRVSQEKGNLDLESVALLNVARAYRLSGNLNQAFATCEQSLKLSRSAKKVLTEMVGLNELANIYAAQKNHKQTIGQYQKILRFYAGISDRRRQAMTWNDLGNAYLRFGEKQEALKSYERALSLSEQGSDKSVLVSSLYNIARAQRDLGALQPALASIEKSIKIIEELRTNVTSPDFRISYFSGVREHYDLCIDILMQLDHRYPGQGFSAAGFLTSERARARSLLDILTEVRADVRQGVAPELLAREQYVRGLLRAQARYQMDLSISAKNSIEKEEVARQINQLRTEYQEIEAQLRDQNPRVSGFSQSAPLSLEQVQAELRGGDTILLEYALGNERSYLWAVTSDSLRSYELPSRSILENAGREVYKLLTTRQEVGEGMAGDYQANVEASDRAYYEKALNLSQLLLGPVADQLGTKRIVIVTEGMLQYIPVDSLPLPRSKVAPNDGIALPATAEDRRLLLDTNEITTLPSVSTLAAIRRHQHKVASSDKLVAIFADPVFNRNDDRVQNKINPDSPSSDLDQHANEVVALRGPAGNAGLPRLVHSSEEADAIVATTPRGTAMVARAFDANRETAMKPSVGGYQIVHFATHGFFNTEHPELSGIVLAMVKPDGSKINGFMPLQDIYKLDLSAQLVVLSACDTALGQDVKGEGLVSLTRGFMYAGSRSVVTSLWKVDDRATAKLMTHFYQAMLQDGMTPAAALRSAKQKIRGEKAWSAPFFWAGFVLQGEYKERIVVRSDPWPRTVLVLPVALILLSGGVIILQRRRRARGLNG